MTDLERLIKAARERGPMTEAELKAQRESFVRAEVGMGSDRDEAAFRAAMDRGDKAEMARLEAEGLARMDRLKDWLL